MMHEECGAERGHNIIIEVIEAIGRDAIAANLLRPEEFLETIRL